ncbi:MAG: hypothetical protein ABSD48_05055 [Armatimonadota bacterium]
MTARDRTRRYAQIIAAGTVLVWALLCFVIILSPRRTKLHNLDQRVATSSKGLADMRKEIEDAKIIGGPAIGGARFDKFGILSNDEEQIFLTDLIAFCKDTTNTLNLVRRSDYAQPTSTTPPEQQGSGKPGAPTGTSPQAQQGPPQAVILRVPHTVSFSGTFVSSFYLLRKLESYRRLLTVERMDLNTDNQSGYPRLIGNITIDLYLVKQPAGTASSPQASTSGTAARPAPAS